MTEHENGRETACAGFRLERLELFNWGTFNGAVQILEPQGNWALLIGDNGSGKSTAIDALRTLLVPPRMLNYNDASGDGRRGAGRDRTRRSYIRGAWASSSTIDSTSATTQYLRESGTLSAILAVFTDAARQSSVTLAQVLWEHDEQVRELYVVSSRRNSLRELLAERSNSTEIRRAARAEGWDVYDTFAPYAERVRGLLHIPGDKALEVFNRAIGMKEVGDIDAFIRQFMLPSADTFTFIRETVQPHYRTLLDCWMAITRAERQIELLRPVHEHGSRIAVGEVHIQSWKRLQEIARPFLATRQLGLLRTTLRDLAECIVSATAASERCDASLTAAREERERVIATLNSSEVGAQLQRIDERLRQAEENRQRAQQRRDSAEKSMQILEDTESLIDSSAFAAARMHWKELAERESERSRDAEERAAARKFEQEQALRACQELTDELNSVERNRVNIPRRYLELRTKIAVAVGVPADELPFAGELLEVLEEYAEWTGAIERLLHSFGLSLLVPESLYRHAADFIDRTHLGLRLDFTAVPVREYAAPHFVNDRVSGRLRYRTDHPVCSWVVHEVVRLFNHRCCVNVAELERVEYGITRYGLIRNGARHTKDDRRFVDDPSERILGWSTEKKLAALRHQIADFEQRAAAAGQVAAQARNAGETARTRASAARDLLAIMDFDDIAPRQWSDQILRLRTERELLERSSTELHALRTRAEELAVVIAMLDKDSKRLYTECVQQHNEFDQLDAQRLSLEQELTDFGDDIYRTAEAEFTTLAIEFAPLTTANLDQVLHVTHTRLQGFINREQGMVREAGEKMTSRMSEFLSEFGEFRQTLLPERAYFEDFLSVMHRIEAEELPQHRDRFEQYLNENLVGNLSMLNRRLDEHYEAIEGRIAEINLALRAIEYSDDTYVQLRPMMRPNAEVSEFRRALRDCFERGISPGPEERMQVFNRVRTLLDDFQQKPEQTQRVCDVRNWMSAGVRELRRLDDSEANYYAATTGRSGGQKAKLAFTILASALSAQYGLSTAPTDAPNFRLVVIDEAFSRTDEQNSTRAMQLFSRLGFQVLIVGPFDAKAKLAVPFVETIHLASNPAGNRSVLTTLARGTVESSDTYKGD